VHTYKVSLVNERREALPSERVSRLRVPSERSAQRGFSPSKHMQKRGCPVNGAHRDTGNSCVYSMRHVQCSNLCALLVLLHAACTYHSATCKYCTTPKCCVHIVCGAATECFSGKTGGDIEATEIYSQHVSQQGRGARRDLCRLGCSRPLVSLSKTLSLALCLSLKTLSYHSLIQSYRINLISVLNIRRQGNINTHTHIYLIYLSIHLSIYIPGRG
jgi:hypothetical protein